MKAILLVSALAATALVAGPYIGLKAEQPLEAYADQAYGVAPALALGTRLEQSGNFSFRLELGGSYAAGLGDYGGQKLWHVAVRAMEEANASPLLDAHLGVGVMYIYASERMPEADPLGNIVDRWYAGSGLGICGLAGVRLWRSGSTRLDFEAGFDLASVRTGRRSDPWDDGSLPLANFNVGLVMRFGEKSAPTTETRKSCTGCLQ